MKVLIIGGVAGGATAAARLRRLDEQAEIIVFERSGYVSYANCGLPYYIGGVIQEEKKLTLQTPQSFRSRFNIDVRVRSEVTKIDPAVQTVTVHDLANDRFYTESYDKLILSPGARAVVPPLPGADGKRVFTLRTVEDTFRIRDFLEQRKPTRAVVVGGGFVGLEMAENLMARGLDVTLVEQLDQVMPPFDFDMAQEIHAGLRARGLHLCLSTAVTAITDHDTGPVTVSLKNGQSLDCDLVLLAVGVAPDTALAKAAGLELGERGSIVVDEHMRTSQPDIYAVGDAVRIRHRVTGKAGLISLAGPANKQGRIAADHICGLPSAYRGAMGSSVIKLFDMTAAATGLNEKTAKALGVCYDKALLFSASHASYYPGGTNMSIKVLFDPESGRILGAQIVGADGVDKRIDVLATAIHAGMTAADLEELDLSYAPPYASAKDPVNMAGYVIENLRMGLVKQYHWHDVASLPRDGSVTMLDVRTDAEYAQGHIDGTVHIPLDQLRMRMSELDPAKPLYINCRSGQRSYIACRLLGQYGYDCHNLAGGFRFYEVVTGNPPLGDSRVGECGLPL
ncbi:MAG: FAD-dependent oxidoreductase [Clostridia bacterium]|nr:FAD-dependent oxidoreductase [Clostridia bacterium]